MTTDGLFISFEGIDGAGKSTHINRIKEHFEQAGRLVCLTREPGGTALAETLRTLVLHQDMDVLTETLLMFAGRRDHVVRVILPALNRGEVVLCDRFIDASFAYQGGGRGFSLNTLKTLEQWVLADETCQQAGYPLLMPHASFWFDVQPEIAAQRLALSRAADNFESQPLAFFTRVANTYRARMDADTERFIHIDANQTAEHVEQAVLAALASKGWTAHA